MKPNLIDVYVDGGHFGMRTWHNVPRVGDSLELIDGGIVHVRGCLWRELQPSNDRSRIYDAHITLNCTRDAT